MSYGASEIAKYIINYCNNEEMPVSNLRLQKLLYFAWITYFKQTRKELFFDSMCAWQLGPVVPSVYFEYCAFGGMTINRHYDVELHSDDDKRILNNFLEEYKPISTRELVDRSHSSGGAWYCVFDNGAGHHATIPFELIKLIECDEVA